MKAYYVLTGIGHFLAGVLTTLAAAFINPGLAAILFATFIIYELDEDWHIKDRAYRDIKVYGIGLFIAVAYLIIKGWLHGSI